MVCREAPLRYTEFRLFEGGRGAMVCREAPLRYTHRVPHSMTRDAMVCREAPLRYTLSADAAEEKALWFAGKRR